MKTLDETLIELSEKYRDDLESLETKIVKTIEDIGDIMVVSFYCKDGEISDAEILIHFLAGEDPHLEISVCHEIGHVKAIKSGSQKIIDPQNTEEKIIVESGADKLAEQIFKGANAKKEIARWLKSDIQQARKHLKHAEYGDVFKERFMILIARLKEFVYNHPVGNILASGIFICYNIYRLNINYIRIWELKIRWIAHLHPKAQKTLQKKKSTKMAKRLSCLEQVP